MTARMEAARQRELASDSHGCEPTKPTIVTRVDRIPAQAAILSSSVAMEKVIWVAGPRERRARSEGREVGGELTGIGGGRALLAR